MPQDMMKQGMMSSREPRGAREPQPLGEQAAPIEGEESAGGFQKLVVDTHRQMSKIVEVLQSAGLPEDQLSAFKALIEQYTGFFKSLSNSGQEPAPTEQAPEPMARKSQPVPAESAGRGMPRL